MPDSSVAAQECKASKCDCRPVGEGMAPRSRNPHGYCQREYASGHIPRANPRTCSRPTRPSNSGCVQAVFPSENALDKRFRNPPESKDGHSPAIAPRCPVCVQRTVRDCCLLA